VEYLTLTLSPLSTTAGDFSKVNPGLILFAILFMTRVQYDTATEWTDQKLKDGKVHF